MIVGLDDCELLYDAIKQDSSGSEEKHVLIYVSTEEVDSVCALGVLQVASPPRCSKLPCAAKPVQQPLPLCSPFLLSPVRAMH